MENKLIRISRNTIIGFFALVFIMGFFSKSIINLFLPKVMVELASVGEVEKTLSVDGVINAKESLEIRLGSEVIIEEYYVNKGDMVMIGTPIFKINKWLDTKDALNQMTDLKLKLERQKLMLERVKIEVRNAQASEDALLKKEKNLEIKEINQSILQLEASIKKLEVQQQYYSNVAENGIYYAEAVGIVLDINKTHVLLQPDEIVIKFAEVGEGQKYAFAADIDSADFDFVKEAGRIELELNSSKSPVSVDITRMSSLIENGTIQVECDVEGQLNKDFTIGQRIQGTISKSYREDRLKAVPKNAAVVFGGYKEGNDGFVYILEKSEGILGKEYTARKVDIKVFAVGDEDILVSGLEQYDKPAVITNISYKINDGTKVFLWQ